jgi:hypothetical protein
MNYVGSFLLLATTISLSFSQQRLADVSPSEIVSLRQIVQRDLGEEPGKVLSLAQRNGAWALIVKAPPELEALEHSILVTGDSTSKRAMMLDGRFDWIVMDDNHHLHLRYWRTISNRGPTRFLETDFTGKKLRTGVVPEINAVPMVMGNITKWKTTKGLFDPLVESLGFSNPYDSNEQFGEWVDYLGLPGNRHLSLGHLAERINLFSADNALMASPSVDLDSAYRLLGLPIPRHSDPSTGQTRVGEVTTTTGGLLCICLSDVPSWGPANIALFEPETGALKFVFQAFRPKAEGRRSKPFNPEGVITAGLIAYGDFLVIVDPSMGLLVKY